MIQLVEYDKRFINQQRWIWHTDAKSNKDKLVELHPYSCLSKIDDDVPNLNLPFSPKDSITLYDTILEHFEKYYGDNLDEDLEILLDNMSPDLYFENMKPSQILTLNDSKDYESFLKVEFVKLYKDYPDIIKNVLDSFKIENDKCDNILDLLYECENKDMLPMLIFNTNSDYCVEIFKDIYDKLIYEETRNYPYHYDILEYKNDLYMKYLEKEKNLLTISKQINIVKIHNLIY